MAVSASMYGLFFKSLANKEVNLTSDTIKAMLVSSSYTPDQDAHQYKSSVTSEISGTGYTAGGKTLTGVTLNYSAGTNTLTFDCDDPAWAGSTLTARRVIFYDATPGTDATRPLICYADLGADVSTTSGTFTVTIDPAGLFSITVA